MTLKKWSPEKAMSCNVILEDEQKDAKGPAEESNVPATRGPLISTRMVTTYLLCLGILTIYTQRMNLSVAIVAMVNSTAIRLLESSATSQNSSSGLDTADTCPTSINVTSDSQDSDGRFIWSETTQGLILGAFLYGYIPTQGLGGRLAEIIGGKITFGLGLIAATVLTFLTPLAANAGITALVAVRTILGIAQGLNVPAAYQMTVEWSLPEERSTNLAIALTGGHIGNILTMPLAGVLCDSQFLGGWPSAFYVVGFLGCLATVLWALGGFDRPSVHPRISVAELQLLERSRDSNGKKQKVSVPWLAMAKSVPLWATIFAKMTIVWTYNMISTKIPAYFEAVLHIPIKQNGMLNAVIYGALTLSLLCSARACDFILTRTRFSRTVIRKSFQGIASFGSAVSLFLLVTVRCNSVAAVSLLVLSMLFYGLAAGGESPNCFDLAPAFSGTISGIGNMMASLSGSFAPVVAGLFLEGKGNSLTQWNYVFYLCGAVQALGGIVFLMFASGEEQPWSREVQDATPHQADKSTYSEKERY